MLKQLNKAEYSDRVMLGEADASSLFRSGLEYSAPARGTWNIVHTGMLIPEAHEIFVCAAGCLRGVVLTAAEMKAENRFSTVEITEENVQNGDMETMIESGVSYILNNLKKLPPAVLLYTSCIHHFLACDMELVFNNLASLYPNVRFSHCYMNPIMRKSGFTPDQLMRRQLYSFLEKRTTNEKSINIIGNDLPIDATSELNSIISSAGFTLRDITKAKSFEEYLEMSNGSINITTFPAANVAADELSQRLGQRSLYLPESFDYSVIRSNINALCEITGAQFNHDSALESCTDALNKLKTAIGDTPVAIDYTAVNRPFELALLLIRHQINVTRIYTDAIQSEELAAFNSLKELRPDIMLYPTLSPSMRCAERCTDVKLLAIGQKAAYFTGTDYFVNIVEGGGHYGYDGIVRLCDDMLDAFYNKKDARKLIQIKGKGCGCCI